MLDIGVNINAKISLMTPDLVFQNSSTIAVLMWALMIFLPKWKGTQFMTKFKLIPVGFSILYTIYIIISLRSGGGMDFSSLDSVMQLFTNKNAMLAGWIHYLAFDLLVGMWILEKNKEIRIHHLLIVPCLIGTFMLGPIGFLLFILLKTIKTKIS